MNLSEIDLSLYMYIYISVKVLSDSCELLDLKKKKEIIKYILYINFFKFWVDLTRVYFGFFFFFTYVSAAETNTRWALSIGFDRAPSGSKLIKFCEKAYHTVPYHTTRNINE